YIFTKLRKATFLKHLTKWTVQDIKFKGVIVIPDIRDVIERLPKSESSLKPGFEKLELLRLFNVWNG
ncbi:MAG: hypothetical protein GY749_26545, partial [Desulfobacteraceae bacterium]|nr:hypothetical protein [Desulfobacteraceae bacterium]